MCLSYVPLDQRPTDSGAGSCRRVDGRRAPGHAPRRPPGPRRRVFENRATLWGMCDELTAQDLWPLILKLPHHERVRLAMLALRAASKAAEDAGAYGASPPRADEFSSDEEPLAWEAEGWEQFDAPR